MVTMELSFIGLEFDEFVQQKKEKKKEKLVPPQQE